ncbi:MAG TPA: hypothetical protein PL182_01120, partial [Pseudobdellovibrionaceae bacterium]|nr:hypothetical protein [Pseudobdellovibrionaceae bacterium]
MTKSFALSLILLAFASSASADSTAQQFIAGLFQVLPPKAAPYIGKNNGRACAVTVSFQPSYQLYIGKIVSKRGRGYKAPPPPMM